MTLSYINQKLLSHQSPRTGKVVRKMLLYVLPFVVSSLKPLCTDTIRCYVWWNLFWLWSPQETNIKSQNSIKNIFKNM